MGTALLVEYYLQLPPALRDGHSARKTSPRRQKALERFKKHVGERYTEGTLQRLLDSPSAVGRRAAVFALGLLGTLDSNEPVARRLHDADAAVRRLAGEALWALWFRGDTEDNSRELQHLAGLRDSAELLTGLNALIDRAPAFAEAYNQRAILYFRLKEYQKSVVDCQKALELNPFHFGAHSGLGQCSMRLNKPRAALKAFRAALRIHPGLDGVEEMVRTLEQTLGEEGRRDDKK